MALSSFPKKVGLIFVENLDKKEKILDFDQSACVFFLLQMNKQQSTFEFQIISPTQDTPAAPKDLESWFINEVEIFKAFEHDYNDIDYWIAITSKQFHDRIGWYFYQVNAKPALEEHLWFITSYDWEKNMSPPSLFEFFAFSVYTCTLQCLGLEFSNEKYDHENQQDKYLTRGCIFDYTQNIAHRRILISNPELCSYCKSKIKTLEDNISKKINKPYNLTSDIEKILNRKWMGTIDERDSPFYNLKKMYKYDIERNSGFYKTRIEEFRDNITNHLPEWVIGTIITGMITGLLVVLGIKAE
jgi:hypothetical protein